MLNNAADSTVLGAIHSVLGGSAHHQQVLLDGFLYRQGGIFREWAKRYCELTEDSIYCYSSKGGMRLSQVKFLPTTQFMDANLRYFCFSLSDNLTGEIVYFAAESSSSKETWKEFIITQLSLIQKAHHRKIAKETSSDLHTIATESAQIRNNFLSRPLVYVKIIQARNLTAKDIGGASDPFVEITVGSSKEKTTTRKKTLDPEWGMVFKFDWDPRDRYAKIDVWDEDSLSSNDFLGSVLIPLYSLRDGQSWVAWYPLMKRSSKSNISGEIEIEICCERLPGVDPFIDRLFREIVLLPEFNFKFLPNPRNVDSHECSPQSGSSEGWKSLREARGFPFYFPPSETEQLEDISIGATLIAQTYFGKVSSSGVLFLTNYRLIFFSQIRLQNNAHVQRNMLLRESDLTCQIPVSSIIDLSLTADPDTTTQFNSGSTEVLSMRTIDGRGLTFLFSSEGRSNQDTSGGASGREYSSSGRFPPTTPLQSVSLATPTGNEIDIHAQSTRLNGKKGGLNISNRVFGNHSDSSSRLDSSSGKLSDITPSSTPPPQTGTPRRGNTDGTPQPRPFDLPTPTDTSSATTPAMDQLYVKDHARLVFEQIGVGRAWEQLLANRSVMFVDACDSEEGGPAARMYTRLYSRRVSRHSERLVHLLQNSSLLDFISKSCVNNVRDADTVDRVPLGGAAASSEGVEEPEVTFDDLLQLNFSRAVLEDRFMLNSSIDERATIFSALENGWYVYDAMAEFGRMGIPDSQWRVSDANVRYELCPTYPALTVVPVTVDDVTLAAAAVFRSKCRYPALSWRSKINYCSIVRCSQPLVGISFQRSEQDEYLLGEIAKCAGGVIRTSGKITDGLQNFVSNSSRKCYVIADARPQLNAVANQAAGKGVENERYYENATIIFIGIPNIHAVRKSLELMEEACLDEISFATKVEQSGWLINISKVLKGVTKIVHCVGFEDLSVIVHCSDGWDRTAQLTSLSMLLLDSYYRTLKGFVVLIEKEWCSFGHKFADRCGWGYDGFKSDERSPVFHQFLDCVYQCMHQLPTVFEFNEDLLLFILEHLQSGWFGDFMFNCEKEKRDFKSENGGLSMWAVVLHNSERFMNPSYHQESGAVLPVARSGRMVVWSKWFNNWHDRIWRSAWIQDSTIEDTEESYHVAKAWIEDKTVVGCRRCSKLFSITRRRHHCRRCGHIFCEKCAGESRIVSWVSAWKPSRVCIECAGLIDQGISEIHEPPTAHRPRLESALHHSQSEPSLAPPTNPQDLSIGERSTNQGLVDDWNGEY